MGTRANRLTVCTATPNPIANDHLLEAYYATIVAIASVLAAWPERPARGEDRTSVAANLRPAAIARACGRTTLPFAKVCC
jgi:hypothetical protein